MKGKSMSATSNVFAYVQDGKHFLNLGTSYARSPICTHDVNLYYCVEDDLFFGDEINASGWEDLTSEDAVRYADMFGARELVAQTLATEPHWVEA